MSSLRWTGVGHRAGILSFAIKNYQNPHPGQKIIVKISRNKCFTSHLLFEIDRSNAWCQVKIPTLGICVTVKFPWVALPPLPLGIDIDICINIPPRPVGNRGRFSNMSGLSYLTCVKLNWPISNLRSESERKYSNRTRTIAGPLPLTHPLTIRKQNPIRRTCLQARGLGDSETRAARCGDSERGTRGLGDSET